MDDTISRADAIYAIVNTVSDVGLHDNSETARYGATYRQQEIITILKSLPSAAREGHWIKHGEPPWYVIECSECGAKWQMSGSWDANNFCGNCGADMRGESDD